MFLENRGWGNTSFAKANDQFGVHYYSGCLYISRIWQHIIWSNTDLLKSIYLSKLFSYLEKKKKKKEFSYYGGRVNYQAISPFTYGEILYHFSQILYNT